MKHLSSAASSGYAPRRRTLLMHAGGAAAAVALPVLGHAQTAAWPNHSLRMLVPFTPGGTTDFVTRLVATELTRTLGQSALIENKPGAGTVIGVDTIAKSAPDGYNYVTVANSFCVNQTLVKNLPYDSTRDLRPVAAMGMSEHVLATHPGSGIRSMADLRAKAREKGVTISYASFGNGTSAHLAGEMLRLQTGIDLVHVPYKGQAPALADLLGGQVTLMFGNWPEFRTHIQSGKLIAIGMATAKRKAIYGDIPTLAEQGVPIESNSWNGLLTPAATPDAIVERMNKAVNAALASAPVAKAFDEGAIISLAGTPAHFAEFIRTEIKRYADVIHKAHITTS